MMCPKLPPAQERLCTPPESNLSTAAFTSPMVAIRAAKYEIVYVYLSSMIAIEMDSDHSLISIIVKATVCPFFQLVVIILVLAIDGICTHPGCSAACPRSPCWRAARADWRTSVPAAGRDYPVSSVRASAQNMFVCQ